MTDPGQKHNNATPNHKRPLVPSSPDENELSRRLSSLHHVFGMDVSNRSCPLLLEKSEILYVAGNHVIHLNLNTKCRRYILGLDGGGIGCIALDSRKKTLFVGEKGERPSIYVYSLPEFAVLKRLQGGAVKGYACIGLNSDESKLCSVSSSPDFSLTIWDWRNEKAILCTKAFRQDIFKVAFSPYDDGKIVTCGNGHIRFWRMSQTFTGLKLKGEIGKFGQVDLSDIVDFAVLPDGKVLSGSESGHLLLWEGHHIKCRLVCCTTTTKGNVGQQNEHELSPVHRGRINFIRHDVSSAHVITAGAFDGWVKWWALDVIDAAIVDRDATIDFVIEPVRELQLGENISIGNIEGVFKNEDETYVKNLNGTIMKVDLDEGGVSTEWHFHSGGIAGIDASPVDNFAVTAGIDGSLRCWDYVRKVPIATIMCRCSCSGVKYVPKQISPSGRSVLVGFNDGNLRCFHLDGEKWALTVALKPHKEKITCIEFSLNGQFLATSSEDETVFIFACDKQPGGISSFTPIGFVNCENSPNSLSWRSDGLALLLTASNGKMIDVDLSHPKLLEPSKRNTYLLNAPRRELRITDLVADGRFCRGREQSKDCASTPTSIKGGFCVYAAYSIHKKDSLLLSVRDENCFFECSLDGKRVHREYMVSKGGGGPQQQKHNSPSTVANMIKFSQSGNFMLTCAGDGSLTVRSASNPEYFTTYAGHDVGKSVTGAVFSKDDNYLLSAGADGSLVVHRMDSQTLQVATSSRDMNYADNDFDSHDNLHGDEANFEAPKGFVVIHPSLQTHDLNVPVTECIDILNECSIQEDLLRSEQDKRLFDADRKKHAVRKVVANMRNEYLQLVEQNSSIPNESRLSKEEMIVDVEYTDLLNEQRCEDLLEVQRECAYESEKAAKRLTKIRKKYLDVLDYEHFVVRGLRNNQKVQTFACLGLSPFVKEALSRRYVQHNDGMSNINQHSVDSEVANGSPGHICKPNDRESSPEKCAPKQTTFELRKVMRERRKQELAQKLSERPNEDVDDSNDGVRSIENAKKLLGDYKLKASAEYLVPDELQISAEKKLEELVLLEESLHTMKCAFNRRLIWLRDSIKRSLIDAIIAGNERICQIDRSLNQPSLSSHLWQTYQCPSEFPESRREFTEADKQQYTSGILAYADDIAKVTVPVSTLLPPKEMRPGDRLRRMKKEDPDSIQAFVPTITPTRQNSLSRKGSPDALLDVTTIFPTMVPTSDEIVEGSNAWGEHKLGLQHERDIIQQDLEQRIESFDNSLASLRKERFQLATELKAGECRLLVLHQELDLLSKLGSKDEVLHKKLINCQKKKEETIAFISNCQSKLDAKKLVLNDLVQKDKTIFDEFINVVPESHPHNAALKKIFARKIRRSSYSYNDDESYGDGDFDDDDDFDSDDEEMNDSCPTGCEPIIYDKILDLREKRIAHEESLKEFQKELGDLKRCSDRYKTRQEQVDKELCSVKTEIRKFQSEKQRALNELLITIPLKTEHVYLWNGPADDDKKKITIPDKSARGIKTATEMSDAVVFSNKQFVKLRRRIVELQAEINREKHHFKDMQKEKVRLERNQTAKEEVIQKQAERCSELQLLKFGQLVDIEALDKASVNMDDVDIRSKEEESKVTTDNEKEIAGIQEDHERLKEQLLSRTHENTAILTHIAELSEKQLFYSKEYANEDNRPRAENCIVSKDACDAEHRNLVKQLRLQSEEMKQVKAEIAMLKRKDGK